MRRLGNEKQLELQTAGTRVGPLVHWTGFVGLAEIWYGEGSYRQRLFAPETRWHT